VPRGAPVKLEYKAYWIERELDNFDTRNVDRFEVPPQTKKIIRECLPSIKETDAQVYFRFVDCDN
jgi:hypothetical protein